MFLGVAETQCIEEVFDPKFQPQGNKEMMLFGEKPKFSFSVLDTTLKTVMGKAHIQKYAKSRNAQQV